MPGATFGDVAVSFFLAGAVFGDFGVSLFVAGAAFGDVAVSLFVAGAAFCEIGSRRVRDDEFMLGSLDHARIMVGSSSNRPPL